MMKWLLDFLARLFSGTPSPDPAPVPDPTPDVNGDVAQQLLAAHNRQRALKGLPLLKLDPKLSSAAQAHSVWMFEHGQMSHDERGVGPATRITHAGYRWNGCGENIAAGFVGVAGVMNAWMSSSGHRHNILGNYSDVGFGVKGNYWTADFGLPATAQGLEVHTVSAYFCETN